ncbi:hypothetical protein GXW82_44610 [Streptacidiphilus sp. 4-A2]|nr:hypothetical protein [Streptacidiphilus sp. 4-A2]
MDDTRSRPVLLLDIDGVLSPYAAARPLPGYRPHRARPTAWRDWAAMVYPRPDHLRLLLNPHIGRRLEKLPVDLVWAGAWQPPELQQLLGPLGLAVLPPSVPLQKGPFFMRLDNPGVSPHADDDQWWRAQGILGWSRGHDRPLAWLAPHFAPGVPAEVARHHAAPVLLHEVDPATGLTDADFTTLEHWARQVAALPPAPVVVPRRCRDCGGRSTTVVDGRRVDRVHDRCGSCCECYCLDRSDRSGDFSACGDLAEESCPDCRCCRICVGCHC